MGLYYWIVLGAYVPVSFCVRSLAIANLIVLVSPGFRHCAKIQSHRKLDPNAKTRVGSEAVSFCLPFALVVSVPLNGRGNHAP
jgi:hypothetical protein